MNENENITICQLVKAVVTLRAFCENLMPGLDGNLAKWALKPDTALAKADEKQPAKTTAKPKAKKKPTKAKPVAHVEAKQSGTNPKK